MTTVKEFKDLGVEFVKDDKCRDDNGVFTEGWYLYGNIEGDSFDLCKVTHFAWRPIGTLPDNPKFKYEVDTNTHSWRPLLDQSSENKRVGVMSNGDEVELVAANDDEPAFTQAMTDMQYELELHKANSKLLVTLTNFMVKNNIGNIGESCIDVAIRELSEKHGIDTRTPKQKAVDQMFEDAEVQGSKGAFERLYDKGYRKC